MNQIVFPSHGGIPISKNISPTLDNYSMVDASSRKIFGGINSTEESIEKYGLELGAGHDFFRKAPCDYGPWEYRDIINGRSSLNFGDIWRFPISHDGVPHVLIHFCWDFLFNDKHPAMVYVFQNDELEASTFLHSTTIMFFRLKKISWGFKPVGFLGIF